MLCCHNDQETSGISVFSVNPAERQIFAFHEVNFPTCRFIINIKQQRTDTKWSIAINLYFTLIVQDVNILILILLIKDSH